MAFLNPFLLLGALALAVPVLVHMVRREQATVIPFGSLMFLARVPKRFIRQQKLKNLLLMALRLLILALLVAAFARPYVMESAVPDAAAGEQANGVVMMLDVSYSMRYGTTFERMKNDAIGWIDGLGPEDRMVIVAFADAPSVLTANPTSNKDELRATVNALEPSYGGTRYFDAFAAADRMLAQFGSQPKRLIVISDFQRVGWNRSGRENIIGREVDVRMIDLGVENSTNVGIESVSVDATTFNRLYEGRVTARVRNYRLDDPIAVPVILNINERELSRRTINVPANGTALAEFTGFELPLGFSEGMIRIETDDPLQVDNEFRFTLDRRDRLSLLVIDAGRPQQSLYLREAFSSSAALPFELRVLPAANVTAAELERHQVVVVNDVPRLADAVMDRMQELRRSGQGQLVILGSNAELDWWRNVAGFPVVPGQKVFAQRDRNRSSFSITSHDRSHSIFRRFQTGQGLALNTAQFFAYTEMEVREGAHVLARLDNGLPVLVESPEEDSGLLVFASAVDNPIAGWNDLPLKPTLFIPLFHEVVRYLSRYNEVRGWYTVGEGVPVAGGRETAAAAIVTPSGERESLGDIGPAEQKFFHPLLPGFYQVRVGPDLRMVAVNPPSSEGNLGKMPAEDLLASIQSTTAETQQSGLLIDDSPEDQAKRQMWWWYLLLFALLAGIAEIYMANRSQRTQAESVTS